MDRSHPREPNPFSVWRRWQRACFGNTRPQVRTLPPRPLSPFTSTNFKNHHGSLDDPAQAGRRARTNGNLRCHASPRGAPSATHARLQQGDRRSGARLFRRSCARSPRLASADEDARRRALAPCRCAAPLRALSGSGNARTCLDRSRGARCDAARRAASTGFSRSRSIRNLGQSRFGASPTGWRTRTSATCSNAGPRRAELPCGRSPRVLGCGRSSMAEPRAVNSLVPVRLRPATPKRMWRQCVANSSGRVPGSYPGMSGFEPLATHQYYPSWRNRQTHRFQKPGPQTGMSVRLGPRGPDVGLQTQWQRARLFPYLIRRARVRHSAPAPISQTRRSREASDNRL